MKKGLKSLIAMVCCAGVMFASTACDDVLKTLEEALEGVDAIASMTEEEVYSDLKYLIENPATQEHKLFKEEITFTAMIYSDPEEVEFEDDDTVYLYQDAVIARCDDFFVLNVTDLKTTPQMGEVISVTGVVVGSLYWIEDNKQIDILDVTMKSFEVMNPDFENPSAKNLFSVTPSLSSVKCNLTFTQAQKATAMNNEYIVVYCDFTNNDTKPRAPRISSLALWQGDAYLSQSNMPFTLEGIELRSDALKGEAFADETKAGDTVTYYYVLSSEDVVTDAPIEVYQYDDDFNLIGFAEIPLS